MKPWLLLVKGNDQGVGLVNSDVGCRVQRNETKQREQTWKHAAGTEDGVMRNYLASLDSLP
jgi:hypothetical protein